MEEPCLLVGFFFYFKYDMIYEKKDKLQMERRAVMIYFTSDLHFYHNNIIESCNRPFADFEEMNQALIKNWNKKIKAKDEVYILGDVTLKGPTFAMEILPQLNGRKHLIKGNHDLFVRKESFDQSLFESIRDYYELKYNNRYYILFHYKIATWNGMHRGSIHLHGHQHNHPEYNQSNLANKLRCYDVGVDANNMTPISIAEIDAFFAELEVEKNEE